MVEMQHLEITVLHVLVQGTASIESNVALQVLKTMSAWIGAYACMYQGYNGIMIYWCLSDSVFQ